MGDLQVLLRIKANGSGAPAAALNWGDFVDVTKSAERSLHRVANVRRRLRRVFAHIDQSMPQERNVAKTKVPASEIAASLPDRLKRLSLPEGKEPRWMRIAPGLYLGYRRTMGGSSSWIARRLRAPGVKAYTEQRIGTPDDFQPADGKLILDYSQACAALLSEGRDVAPSAEIDRAPGGTAEELGRKLRRQLSLEARHVDYEAERQMICATVAAGIEMDAITVGVYDQSFAHFWESLRPLILKRLDEALDPLVLLMQRAAKEGAKP